MSSLVCLDHAPLCFVDRLSLRYASTLEELLTAHADATKWVKFVTDGGTGGGGGGLASGDGWLARGAGLLGLSVGGQETSERTAAAPGPTSEAAPVPAGHGGSGGLGHSEAGAVGA